MKKQLLILFSKYPSSDSKTRIKKDIGPIVAENLCFACLDDLTNKLKMLENIDVVILSDTLSDSKLFYQRYGMNSFDLERMGVPSDFSKSEKFYRIFKYFLRIYSKVALIPMDIPHIHLENIQMAFKKLDEFDSVFGPEYNGGVYLMGFKKIRKKTFKDVEWSTEYSFLDLFKNNKSSIFILEKSFDLNTISDLRLLTPGMLYSCPHLTRFINLFILNKLDTMETIKV